MEKAKYISTQGTVGDLLSNIDRLLKKKTAVSHENSLTLEDKLAVVTHFLHNGVYNNESIKSSSECYMQELKSSFVESELSKVDETKSEYASVGDLFEGFFDVPFISDADHKFTFIDLFAGIGGFRMAMQSLGGKCIFSSELDSQAKKTYLHNYGEMPFGDITKEETKRYIPDEFDLLCAGFPCQAFSLAGKRGGFDDTRGTLFFDVAEIIRRKRPKAIFLENVKGLISHDKGRTLQVILNTLREDLDYYVPDPQVINARNFGVPQNRERIYIVGFRKDCFKSEFIYPHPTDITKTIADIKEREPVTSRYYLSTQYLQTLRDHKQRHASKGNGFGYEILLDDEVANAIVVGGMGRERNLLYDFRLTDFTPETKIKGEVNREGIRKMTPREWARLQGFPDSFRIVVADASAYKQFGNSVAVPAIKATAEQILTQIL
ncbi:MAG: DNA cytosine methyltransferase [Bacteroidales bacterium]